MTDVYYIQPKYHQNYSRPYEPGPIRNTKREWRICCVCKILFVVKLKNKSYVTCQHAKCIQARHMEMKRHADRKYEKNNREYKVAQKRAWRKFGRYVHVCAGWHL